MQSKNVFVNFLSNFYVEVDFAYVTIVNKNHLFSQEDVNVRRHVKL